MPRVRCVPPHNRARITLPGACRWGFAVPSQNGAPQGAAHKREFVQLPHARFIEMLTYKANLVGMRIILQRERHTSQASFLDRNPLPTHDPKRAEKPRFSGKREKCGLCSGWQAHPCRCAGIVQYFTQSIPQFLRAGDRGTGSCSQMARRLNKSENSCARHMRFHFLILFLLPTLG